MTNKEFIDRYVAAFLGAHAANLTVSCRPGWQQELTNHPPVEDAAFQADCAWKKLKELRPELCDD